MKDVVLGLWIASFSVFTVSVVFDIVNMKRKVFFHWTHWVMNISAIFVMVLALIYYLV